MATDTSVGEGVIVVRAGHGGLNELAGGDSAGTPRPSAKDLGNPVSP